ncbi:rod shape-determining protein MreC [Picosynechococcus sp. NKBG042902]|uniref:rod shape-determining protein MreC n=1 Tax=Picosynechococcus sp. NKBG042902 TaxID=490193 RepID=UPI0004ABAD51|nr:rod shape-determining protein MreC [Picosynechococcus sp. NKBG042902]
MLMFRRWWQRYGMTLIFIGVGLSAALFLRQTQGGAIQEFYGLFFRRQSNLTAAETEILLQNSKLRELQNRVEELEAQNQQLQDLLDYRQTLQTEAIAAPVIGRSADAWWQQIIIGQGSQAGIKVGDTVTGIGGLVGRVVQVTPHSSRVALVSDLNQQVGVMLSRSRFQGYLRGQNDPQQAQMVFYEKVPDVKVGDMVTTSNLSTLYAPGLPIGRIAAIDFNAGPAPIATVELTVPLGSLEWVLVAPFEQKPLNFELQPEQDVSQTP